MPDIESDCREQDAVIWQANGFDDDGEVTIGSASDNKVRWQHVEDEVTDVNGNNVAIDALVVTAIDVVVGSIMWEGKIADLPGTGETPTSNIYRVVKFKKTPDVKGRKFRRVSMLEKYSDTLPTVS